MLEITVDGRQQYPLVGTATQKIAVVDVDALSVRFVEFRECERGMLVPIPMPMDGNMALLCAAIRDVRRVLPAGGVEAYAIGTGPTLATLRLARKSGRRAAQFCTLSGVVHV